MGFEATGLPYVADQVGVVNSSSLKERSERMPKP